MFHVSSVSCPENDALERCAYVMQRIMDVMYVSVRFHPPLSPVPIRFMIAGMTEMVMTFMTSSLKRLRINGTLLKKQLSSANSAD